MGAVLPVFTRELALSPTEAGWVVAAFVPGYVIFAPFFGYLGDRGSRPKLMAFGVLLWSIATISTGLAGSFWALIFCRALVGIGEASFVTIAPGFIKDRVQDPIRVNSILSIFYAAVPIGSALGYVTGGIFAEKFSIHSAFFLGGIPGLLAIPWLLRLSDIANRHYPQGSVLDGIRAVCRIRALWFVIGGYVLNAFALNGIAGFVSTYGEQIGFTLQEIGIAFGMILCVAGFLGTFVGGRLASRIARRSRTAGTGLIWYAGITSVAAAPLLLAAFLVQDRQLFLVLCFFAEVLVFASVAPINSLIVMSSPAGSLTLCQGLSILALNLGGAFPAPVVVGAISEASSLKLALQLLSLPLLLSGLVWLGGKKEYDPR